MQPATTVSARRLGLSSPSFIGLLVTQFLGALNDNMFRWLAVPIAKHSIDPDLALSLGLASFTLPYLLLAMPAGYLADRFSKRTVIVWCKVAEIVLMLLGILAILWGSIPFLFAIVALTGAQSALFAPSKFGSIPEMLSDEQLSAGNGWMGLATVVASALGFLFGSLLFSPAYVSPASLASIALGAAALTSVAVAGWLASLCIARLPAANPERQLQPNLLTATGRNLRMLWSDLPLFRAALGIAFFWMLASLVQINIDSFGIEVLRLPQRDIGILGCVLVVGLGLGSVLAGVWSGGKVELGIVPMGALGVVATSLLLFLAGSSVDPHEAISGQQAFYWSCVWLFLLGMAAGLFDIPLEAYLQHRSPPEIRGTILAAANFVSFSFILLASGLFFLMQKVFGMSASGIFLAAGLATLPVAIYIILLLPQATIRFAVWLASHTLYRVRVYGRENLPETGGALLVANHVSWIDGILLIISSSRNIRMLAYADYIENRKIRWLAKLYGAIPIKGDGGPKAMLQSLRTAREALQNGELVCIFAEGALTRTGQLQGFQGGMMRILSGTDAPVIPVYLDGLWGSIFSFRGGRFLWKMPRRWPYPVSILFGPPIAAPEGSGQVRQAVQQLGVDAMQYRKGREKLPPQLFLRQCRRSLFRPKFADSSGLQLTGGKTLAGTLALRRVLEREVLSPDEKMVGVLLPPSVGGVLVNAALTVSGRVPVNLNYTLSNEDLQHCVGEAGLKHVLTSRRFLEKKPVELDVPLVFLEDVKERVTRADKAFAAVAAYATPIPLLERLLGVRRIRPDDLMTIIFTSGSTGEPKGVMLSQHNILSNIDAVDQLFHLTEKDVLLGVLPFFHSFGFTGTLWLALCFDPKGVYHFNPLDGRAIGKLAAEQGATILMSAPTFLRSYLKRCDKEQFSRLDLVITGAEKLPRDLAQEFHDKFGVMPAEGYGCTELSPVAAVNVPDHRSENVEQIGTKLGTVGRPIPGVAAKTVDPETGADLGLNTEGLLLIKGPNVMQGYLNYPEKTAAVIKDGWYNTGDMARIHDDGFIEITGRMSRFSKIGGEMVPHIRIEEALARIIDTPDSDEGLRVAVASVPDPRKGERLVVLHRPLPMPVDLVLSKLSEQGLPNLWIPDADSFVEVEQIPILGTGKLDLKALKQLALERLGPTVAVK